MTEFVHKIVTNFLAFLGKPLTQRISSGFKKIQLFQNLFGSGYAELGIDWMIILRSLTHPLNGPYQIF